MGGEKAKPTSGNETAVQVVGAVDPSPRIQPHGFGINRIGQQIRHPRRRRAERHLLPVDGRETLRDPIDGNAERETGRAVGARQIEQLLDGEDEPRRGFAVTSGGARSVKSTPRP